MSSNNINNTNDVSSEIWVGTDAPANTLYAWIDTDDTARGAMWNKYTNVDQMRGESANLRDGDRCSTENYYENIPGGRAEYDIVTVESDTVFDGGSLIDLREIDDEYHLAARLIVRNGEVDIKQFGAMGNFNSTPTSDQAKAADCIQAAVNFAKESSAHESYNVVFSAGGYYISDTIRISPYVRVVLRGSVIFKNGMSSTDSPSMINICHDIGYNGAPTYSHIISGEGTITLSNSNCTSHDTAVGIRIGNTSDTGNFAYLLYENIIIDGFNIGLQVYAKNFYGCRFKNFDFFACNVGLCYTGNMLNSGELNVFESCVFTQNLIDCKYLARAGEFLFDKCHFDYSICVHHLTCDARIFMNNCHIEGIGNRLASPESRRIPLSPVAVASPATDSSSATYVDLSVYQPFGIVYADSYANNQPHSAQNMGVFLTNTYIVDQLSAYFPLFTFCGDRSYQSDSHSSASLVFDNVWYEMHENMPICFPPIGITDSSGVYFCKYSDSGFLCTECDYTDVNTGEKSKNCSLVNKGFYSAFRNYNYHRVKATRPLRNSELLTMHPYLDNFSLNGTTPSGFNYSVSADTGYSLEVTSPASSSVTDKRMYPFSIIDDNAKALKFTVDNSSQTDLKLALTVEFTDDILECRYNDSFFIQLVTDKLPIVGSGNETISVDDFKNNKNFFYNKILFHQIKVEELYFDGTNYATLGTPETYPVSYNFQESFDPTTLGCTTLNQVNEKYPFPATCALLYKTQHKNVEKLRISAIIPCMGGKSISLHGVLIYKTN